jgi:hypothetical protein
MTIMDGDCCTLSRSIGATGAGGAGTVGTGELNRLRTGLMTIIPYRLSSVGNTEVDRFILREPLTDGADVNPMHRSGNDFTYTANLKTGKRLKFIV